MPGVSNNRIPKFYNVNRSSVLWKQKSRAYRDCLHLWQPCSKAEWEGWGRSPELLTGSTHLHPASPFPSLWELPPGAAPAQGWPVPEPGELSSRSAHRLHHFLLCNCGKTLGETFGKEEGLLEGVEGVARKSNSCPGRSSVTCHQGRPWSREKRWMLAPPILLNSFSLAEFCAEAASFGAGLTLGTLSYSLHAVSILHFLL